MLDENRPFIATRIAVMTVSDTRSLTDDRSGDLLVERLQSAGHTLTDRIVVKDDVGSIQKRLNDWHGSRSVDVALVTGGTGVTGRDVTPEAVEALYTKAIPGFGELFRWQSYEKIGTSTIQSRATGGMIGTMLVFALPGSTSACRDAWDGILASQLDNRHRPCNFVELMPRFGEA